jgi:hypothetical protein
MSAGEDSPCAEGWPLAAQCALQNRVRSVAGKKYFLEENFRANA